MAFDDRVVVGQELEAAIELPALDMAVTWVEGDVALPGRIAAYTRPEQMEG